MVRLTVRIYDGSFKCWPAEKDVHFAFGPKRIGVIIGGGGLFLVVKEVRCKN